MRRSCPPLPSSDRKVSVEQIGEPPDIRWQRPPQHSSELGVTVFDRDLDMNWRRASYSSITNAVHEQPAIASEPEGAAALTLDEEAPGAPRRRGRVRSPPAAEGEGSTRMVPLGLAAMPGGTLVGTLIHGVFERVAFDAPDLVAEVDSALRQEQAYYNVDLGNHGDVVHGLCTAIESPLGPAAGLRLRDVAREHRLDELGFELPLVGGDDATARQVGDLRVTDIATLLSDHVDPADPMCAYADRLRDPVFGDDPLRGFLTGSLDLVLRLPDGRFMLADYKTNRLAAPTRPSPPGTTGRRRSRPRWPRPTIRCRPCSTRWRCTATCAGASPGTTPPGISVAPSISSCVA